MLLCPIRTVVQTLRSPDKSDTKAATRYGSEVPTRNPVIEDGGDRRGKERHPAGMLPEERLTPLNSGVALTRKGALWPSLIPIPSGASPQ